MDGSRKLALALSILLAALAAFDFTVGSPALRLNADTGAAHAAAALWGAGAAYAGRRASSLFLVAIGLLFCTDAFMGATRGTFYLSYDALRGPVEAMARPARYMASATHGLIGAVALVAGLMFANAEAKLNSGAPPA